jgi:hypothetical protein
MKYRSTHEGWQYAAGDTTAGDLPFHFFRADPAFGIGVA